jgi:dipeptidyl aminopeptidase/acylaminoacyl peptidase
LSPRGQSFLTSYLLVQHLSFPIHKSSKVVPRHKFNLAPRKLVRLKYSDAIFALGRIASMGYFVAASQYRGCYDEEQKDDFGGEDLLDVVNLREVLSCLPEIDTNRTGIIGYSRGGMMALLLATKYDWVRAVVTVGGLTDTVSWFGQDTPIEWANARSPLFNAERLRASVPILLMHGENDIVVPCKHAKDFSDRLIQLSIPHELVMFPGGSHYLAEHDAAVAQTLQSWLSSNL